MSKPKILTFKQFDAQARREVCAEYGVTFSKLAALHGAGHYYWAWWRHVLETYEAGAAFTTRHWNTLTPAQQRDVMRTKRALSMPGNVGRPWQIEDHKL